MPSFDGRHVGMLWSLCMLSVNAGEYCSSTPKRTLPDVKSQTDGMYVQIGSFVPAECVRMHVFDSVFTRMGASDNLAMGRSTFLEVTITIPISTCGRIILTLTQIHSY